MEVDIILKGIVFGGPRAAGPGARTAIVGFSIESDDLSTIELNVEVVPEENDPSGIDGAVMVARRTLIEFGKALVEAAEAYEPPMIYSPKSGGVDR